MRTLADLANRFLVLVDEPGASPGNPPNIPANASLNAAFVVDLLNEGLSVFSNESGYAPDVTDKYVQLPVVAGQDYALPSDLVGLNRMEYLQGPSATGNSPAFLPQFSFPQFDVQTVGVYNVQGVPEMYREPFAGKVRFWPYPTAANVANQDQLFLYYVSDGSTMVQWTDLVPLPSAFRNAPVCYALAQTFQRKRALDAAQLWERRFLRICTRAKSQPYDVNQAAELSIGDVEHDPEEIIRW